ncbi:MAG: ATP-dependent zinc metalloprotease FtsH [Thermosynechococcaceae cyanobacterium]
MPSNRNTAPNNQPNPPWSRLLGIGLLVAGLSFFLFTLAPAFLGSNANYERVSYSQFIEQVQSDQVEEALLGEDRIQYQLKEDAAKGDVEQTDDNTVPHYLITNAVAADPDLTRILREHDVDFSGLPASDGGIFGSFFFWLIAPILIFWVLPAVIRIFRGGGGVGGPSGAAGLFNVGKSKARIYSEGETGIKFNDVAGVDEAKAELEEIISFLKDARKYTRLGAKIPKGVLLVGPPGTGKTLLARAVAGEANVPFFSISGSEFIEMFVGVGASRVRDLFEQAKKQSPCIVFIDELDALGRSRSGAGPMSGAGNNEQEQTLNQLLNEMDGFTANNGVVILAATNRPEVLDPALQRPGRFDRQVVVDRPDKIGRRAILEVHVPNVRLADDVDLERIAVRTPGFAGADLANLVNEAALLAARQDKDEVTMADFNEAIERVIAGIEKKSRVLKDSEKKTVAYHEAGHAIVGSLMPGAGKVEKISIVPRGVGALGYTLQMPEEDRFLISEDELRGRIAILLGGRSSEELIFGKVSTGASDDIQKATDLAERSVTIYGMSDKLGPIAYEKQQQQQFLEGMANPRRSISPEVAQEIDREIKQIVDGAHHMALSVLEHNREVLEQMAQTLLEKEVLETQALREQLSQVNAPNELEGWLQTGQFTNKETTASNGRVGAISS